MSVLPFYKQISRVTTEVPAGATSGIMDVIALTIPLKENDFVLIYTPTGKNYRLKLLADLAIGDTALRYSTVSGVGLPFVLNAIPVDSTIMLPDNETALLARTSYQYQTFTGSISAGTAQNWKFSGQYGVTYHTWNRDSGDTGITVGTSTMTVAKQYQHAGIRVPYDCTLVGFSGAGRNNNGNRQFAGGLFVGTPDWGATGSITPTLRAYAAANYSPGTSYTNRPVKVDDLSQSFSVSAGDVIYPAIKSLSGTNDTIQLTFNLVLKTIKA
jgi:hypothetical protein|tara:strand:- start:497 stop:1306 length:810 start_codon:yes stop_codon:yes gene_type:complete